MIYLHYIIKVGKKSSICIVALTIIIFFLKLLYHFRIVNPPSEHYIHFIPSIFFAPIFLTMMVCLDLTVDKDRKVWTTLGWIIATANCTLIYVLYFSQLAIIEPEALIHNRGFFILPQNFYIVAHHIQYFLFGLSLFICSFAFRKDKGMYWSLLSTGICFPIVYISVFYPNLYFPGMLELTIMVAVTKVLLFFRSCTVRDLNQSYSNYFLP